MPTYTVISQTSRMGLAPLTATPLCAIPGRVEVCGLGLHVATVQSDTPDEAMAQVRDAIQIVGGVPEVELLEPYAKRWTVIGTADNGSCPSWNTVAVVAGEHKVQGRWESMLAHRWDYVVDAPDARTADETGYRLAATSRYEEAWD
jgi:hypothetical protein